MSSQRAKDRRQQTPERRQVSDRRRQSEARRAIFEVCRSMLHMALVAPEGKEEGDRIVTRSIRWRNEASSLHTERGVQELTEAFRTLVGEERLAGARVRIALGGEFCVTRVITGPTEDVRREFHELEERSLRYLTLGPGPKALAGHTQQLDARHQHALLAVANQRMLDLLMRIADEVNIQIESIEPSLIALSRTQAHLRNACQDASLMIQLDEEVAELGVCHGGRLLLDYRPGGRTDAENVAGVVAQHLSRLQRFLERYHSYLKSPLRHVYLAGDASAVARAKSKFAELPDFDVHVLEPGDLDMPWKHATETPGTDLAATLGTAMALYSESSEQQGPNLIENALAQLREPIKPILIRSLIPFAAVLAVGAALSLVNFTEWHKIAALRSELDSLAPACARANELRLNLGVTEQKLTDLKALESQLPQPKWEQILDRITQSMPKDVWLDRLTFHDASTATLVGASYTDGGVYEFVEYLKKVPDVADINLESTGVGQTSAGATTNFNLQLTLASNADRSDKGAKP